MLRSAHAVGMASRETRKLGRPRTARSDDVACRGADEVRKGPSTPDNPFSVSWLLDQALMVELEIEISRRTFHFQNRRIFERPARYRRAISRQQCDVALGQALLRRERGAATAAHHRRARRRRDDAALQVDRLILDHAGRELARIVYAVAGAILRHRDADIEPGGLGESADRPTVTCQGEGLSDGRGLLEIAGGRKRKGEKQGHRYPLLVAARAIVRSFARSGNSALCDTRKAWERPEEMGERHG